MLIFLNFHKKVTKKYFFDKPQQLRSRLRSQLRSAGSGGAVTGLIDKERKELELRGTKLNGTQTQTHRDTLSVPA